MKKLFLKISIIASLLLGISQNANAATYNNFRFCVESGNPDGSTPTNNDQIICVGNILYIKNKSYHGCISGSTTPIAGPGLVGWIDVYTSGGTMLKYHYPVTNAPGGTWNYNEVLAVPIFTTTPGTGMHYISVEYWEASITEVTFTTLCPGAVDPTLEFLCYGKVMPNPSITVTASPTAICAGQTTTLTATGGTSYTWSPGGLTGSSVTVSPTTTTVYTVTGTNSNGCSTTKTITIAVNPSPVINLINYSICDLSHMPVLDGGSGGSSYVWTFNGSNAGYTQYMNTSLYGVGTYQVTVTNSYGCSSTGTSVVQLDPSATPNALFNASYTGSTLVQFSVSGVVLNTNNSWELFNSDASGAMLSSIEGISFLGGGNSYTFTTAVPRSAYYRINHNATSNPCLVNGSSYSVIYPSTRGMEVIIDNGKRITESLNFDAFPNPTSGLFTIVVDKSEFSNPIYFSVYDLTGKVVQKETSCLPGNFLEIYLSNHPNGIYLLKGTDGKEIFTKKIIKQ